MDSLHTFTLESNRQSINACLEDDCADELTDEPVMTAIPDKDALAPSRLCPAFLTVWIKIHRLGSISLSENSARSSTQ